MWLLIFRRVAEKQDLCGLMTIGKLRAKVYVETDTKKTFKDVATSKRSSSNSKRSSRCCAIQMPTGGLERGSQRASRARILPIW
jgi:hypothetical protein